jgi:hypothetical protein
VATDTAATSEPDRVVDVLDGFVEVAEPFAENVPSCVEVWGLLLATDMASLALDGVRDAKSALPQ